MDQPATNNQKEEFEQAFRIVEHIGEHERHFNTLEADYRKLASTWLLAALGACGYVLKSDSQMPFDKWYLVCGICIAGSIGLGVLWVLDIKVYHRLLHAFFLEGVKLEMDNPSLRPIRINMARTQRSRNVVTKVQFFYFVSIYLLLIVSAIAVWNFESLAPAARGTLAAILLIIPFGIFRFYTIREKGKTDIEKLIDEYDKKSTAPSTGK